MNPRFLIPGALAAVAALVLVLVLTAEPDVPVADLPATPTIAGSLRLEPRLPAAGDEVEVRATLAADRPVTLRALTVRAVHYGTGESHDFPELRDQDLGTGTREVVLSRRFDTPGEYRYYLAYLLDDRWRSLEPWEEFTIR
ncbi:hypothetical protein [Saccharothrix xinjiangensis]|uniref:Uncharacterized protein n=1 Tax=Saccharothrix xinjiangensis TaxID=204798 RepID=A0ABV9YB32_9PSEU